MVSRICSKARQLQALGAMFRLTSLFANGCSDLAVLLKAVVESILEYGNLGYLAAVPGYLQRFDRIQERAERVCGRQFIALADRQKAVAFGLICELLDGECIGQLQQMYPSLATQG